MNEEEQPTEEELEEDSVEKGSPELDLTEKVPDANEGGSRLLM